MGFFIIKTVIRKLRSDKETEKMLWAS